MTNGRVFTTGDIASMLGASTRSVNAWIDGGKLKGYRLPAMVPNSKKAECRRVTREELVKFIADHDLPMPAELGGPPTPTLLCVGLDDAMIRGLHGVAGGRLSVARRFDLFSAGAAVVELRPMAVLFDLACDRAGCLEAARLLRSGKAAPAVFAVLCDGDDPAELQGDFDGLLLNRHDAAGAFGMVLAVIGKE
jgi:hypothetical protein